MKLATARRAYKTEKAILVDALKGKLVRLPKSQVEIYPDSEVFLPV
jgi:hypothetical protein